MSRPQALALTAATLLGTAVGCLYLWRTLRKPKLKRALTSQNGEVVNRQSSSPNGSEEACYQTSTDHPSNPSPLVHKILGAGAFVVESEVDWDQVWPLVRAELDHYPVIGIDCEWVSMKGKANPVSLLQIASYSGSCLLIRMPQMIRNSSLLPKTLLRVLGDDNILKVGVDCFEDGCRLLRDYCVTVKGCLDLRYLVTQQRKNNLAHSLSLKSLAQDIINFTLDKSLHLRCSNWEAPELTNEQVTYAAQDAQVSVALFFHLLGFSSTSHEDAVLSQSEPSWEQVLARCQGLKDIPFKNKMGGSSRREEGTGETNSQQRRRNKKLGPNQKLPWDTTTVDPRKTQRKPLGVGYSARKSPLYDNCFLHAPDGQPLCTCDRKKAQWYLDKGIGELISKEPFTVKLKFEPSGRPESQQDYYLIAKQNLCVVCGKKESYIRKNIVPHEYRKHFPIQMKDHNSHDVLLLCTACHAASNCYDNVLKQQLAKEFNAPVGSEESVRLLEDPVRRQVRSGARALLNAESLPKARKEELQDILKAFFNVEVLSEELLEEGAALETRIFNESHIPHGLKVTQSCAVGGLRALMSLEKRWRQHFLDYMQPQHLPPLWSVDHNHSKLLRKYGEDLKLELT
ncbi:exonuclease 3'-5' domain-containing protein 2 isoform X1 [Hypanus sabinus]|uniref:exonuclease 3'-5' domain-containing protein 2 isoform X1 n=2 Tax=Hypanus sabinus TaxID=79690 RepID=UPI0028C4796A|nr:exonuclease 3'-5' domain-containing protein 2 isoform X1 [Hypanus sabinus]XP_059809853.1 exonuclease 3'-5' domain-containing protein 2 isoform X1 [Hypanus sabinus]XP_059809860.1 exonuclease 3'-5' domain-containing protein 2 isoform X1 [Hypanus sabinus]XP_059809869.1 exonuclease 3'-5' domain-containing protein 2 isoform X1 [Hypanus sabinus]XP_059809879.1 exonuclease 3'-5' domain-containing protein 2 isoform X1 [Hypanus sabinus]XP_059809886.1 exonuclease 3'-5' domain-containing protein 2 isof